MDLTPKSEARDPNSPEDRNVRLDSMHILVELPTYGLSKNVSQLPVHCYGIPKCCYWTRRRRRWIRALRRLCKQRWIKQRRGGQPSLLPIVYRRSKTLIECEWTPLHFQWTYGSSTCRRYFIKDGRVSESGTHDHLISRKGDYYEYVQLQVLSRRE